MRKLSIAATLLISLTGCGNVAGMSILQQAANPSTAAAAQDRAKKAFERIDADKNGAISLDEFQAGKGRGKGPEGKGPQDADTDKDGKISFDEFKAAKPPHAGAAPTDEQVKAHFDKMDANKDGFISADERQPMGKPGFGGPGGRPHFGGPGFGGPGGFPGRPGHGPKGPTFGADADKDGKITLDELKAAKGPGGQTIPADKAQAFFDKADTNKDGAITKEDRPARGPKPAAQ
jgi:Ca2+-binding EF-hand superfamily protein